MGQQAGVRPVAIRGDPPQLPLRGHRSDVGYCIYLPPGYGTDADRRYPVIYNLHGADGNELPGFREVQMLDAGIRARRWPEMIVVLPKRRQAHVLQGLP